METLMTIADLAEKMRLSEATIRKYVLEKSVPYLKIGAAVRFLPSEIEKWVEARKKSLLSVKKK